MTLVRFTCQNCGVEVARPVGDEGRAKFCSRRCSVLAQRRPSREERFWAKVAKTDGCWEWTGHRNADGYGILGTGPRGAVVHEFAHRVSWQLHFGAIPDGMLVCHHCDNPPCVRPDHLFIGTNAANTRDRDRKGRHRTLRGDEHPQRLDPSKVLRGEAHGNAKLTAADVRAIRQRRAAGEPLAAIAVDYGIRIAAVSSIAKRRTWKHVD